MADPSDFSRRAFQFFTDKGYSPHAAAALAGNADWESRGDTRIHGDKGTAEGLFQWRLDRRTGLHDFARARGLDPYNENTQLQYADWELNNHPTYKASGEALRNAGDLTAANNALVGFLRPQGWTPDNPQGAHGYVPRFNNAAALLNQPGMAQVLASMPPKVIDGPGPGAGLQSAQDAASTQIPPAGQSPAVAQAVARAANPFSLDGSVRNGLALMSGGPDIKPPAAPTEAPIHRPEQTQSLMDLIFPRRQQFTPYG